MSNWIIVFLGGGLGSLFRYGLGHYSDTANTIFPIGSFVANLMACFILGTLLGMQSKGQLSEQYGLLLMTGFCGGFSTFSTFSAESLKLFQNNQAALALFYIGLSVILGLAAVYLGYKVRVSAY